VNKQKPNKGGMSSFVFNYDVKTKVMRATSDLFSFYFHVAAADPNENEVEGNTLFERAWMEQKLFAHGLAKNRDVGGGPFQSGLHRKIKGRKRFDTDGPEIDLADPFFSIENEFIVINVDQMEIKISNTPEHRKGLSDELKKMLNEVDWVCTHNWVEGELKAIDEGQEV
jgi:hypothetical protein